MLDSKELAIQVARAALEKKAENILILDVEKRLIITDYFIICSGLNVIQVQSISEFIQESLEKEGYRPVRVEGDGQSGWVLLDYLDVVVHVFSAEQRDYYQLERLWKDSSIIEWQR
ncbi:ribosome-associated protein [Candidatus Hakubella thermalkaliphila]|uniref:Ribosomal silencing factor RsfS n=1 Tax=Candidatus Hakubella thermalkaliphila TaxID=2754717 RepID=A0A6V8PFH8_9ACTN|nr:ribosome silencing factor [Candidatus Hakubella thermalkaliphila]GFP30434.1 ribosome-associated protein [Candidatus Hakubella thermalkaliphila]GFP37171.1 ribosome-associated protein [Candidatus Hakubella thermalkaliphila]GFP39664.1 ribosome-associated protein [Candidatus Hakubella thermalkaliphila]GFP42182.1 ribosome-associated protein [Candidatus Hakubella thermalkaliphila]